MVDLLGRNDNLAAAQEETSMFRNLAFLALIPLSAAALAQTPLRVKVFPGSQNLPLIAGVSQGFFEGRGLKVEVLFTQSSQEQRDGLASGDFQIAHSAVDNAVAMVELAKKDVVVVTGGDSSLNELFVQPYVNSVADLRGRTVIVDAPNTAYALQLKKVLLMSGLKEGADYKVQPLGATFLRVRANRDAAAKLLVERFKVDPQLAERMMQYLVDPKFGLNTDARLDLAGFRNVLALRAEIEGSWGGKPPAPERYVDLSYYENALKKIPR